MERKGARIARNGYREIVASLQERIETGNIEPGCFLSTERELQTEFGAGRSTIRKALATLVELGWAQTVPNKGVIAGRGLRPAPSNRIALVENGTAVQQILGTHFDVMLGEMGYQLVHVGGKMEYPLDYALQRVLDEEFAGAIIWCFDGFPDMDLVGRLLRQMPVVALDHRLGNAETDLVAFDHEAAAYEATEALIRNGARRIGVTGMLDSLEITHARFRGYMRAVLAHGIKPDARDFVFTNTSGGDPTVRTEMLELRLRAFDRPDAFFVLQDFCLPSTVDCALRVGLSLPRDLRLATIGDDVSVDVDGYGLTAIAFDWEALASEAFHMLAERLGDLHRAPQVRLVPHRLVVRGLCGAPVSDWSLESERLVGLRGEMPFEKAHYRYSSRWSVQMDASKAHIEVKS